MARKPKKGLSNCLCLFSLVCLFFSRPQKLVSSSQDKKRKIKKTQRFILFTQLRFVRRQLVKNEILLVAVLCRKSELTTTPWRLYAFTWSYLDWNKDRTYYSRSCKQINVLSSTPWWTNQNQFHIIVNPSSVISGKYLDRKLCINKIFRRCPWCNGYRRRKWTRRHEFISWRKLIAFSHSTNTLGKGMNPIILPPAMGK